MRALINHPWQVDKQVNGGHWLSMGSRTDYDEALEWAESLLAFHLERCPKDRVEMRVSTPWTEHRISNDVIA